MTIPHRSQPDQPSHEVPTDPPVLPPFPPFGNLSVDSWVTLAENQLELAVIEAQLSDVSAPIATKDGLKLLAAVSANGLDPMRVEATERRDINVSVGDDGGPVVVEDVTAGWQFSAPGIPFTAVVLPTSMTLQTNQYVSFGSSLGRPFFTFLQGVSDVLHPSAISRLGLRYINRLVDDAALTPEFWVGRIEEPFLGPIRNAAIAGLTTGAQQQFELALEGAIGATVRYGLISDGQPTPRWSYLVDIDVYDSALTLLDPNRSFEHARRLNATALALFQLLVTPAYRGALGPVGVPLRTEAVS